MVVVRKGSGLLIPFIFYLNLHVKYLLMRQKYSSGVKGVIEMDTSPLAGERPGEGQIVLMAETGRRTGEETLSLQRFFQSLFLSSVLEKNMTE
jgi:hypothetical protein